MGYLRHCLELIKGNNMIDIAQFNCVGFLFLKKNKISSNRVFDYFLTEANIWLSFKLNFYLQIIKDRFTNE